MGRVATVAFAALVLAGCATTQAARPPGDDAGKAVVQPLKDLSLIRQRPPEALTRAAADPYAPPGACEDSAREIADLDAALGPDVDVKSAKGGDFASDLVGDAIQGAVGLPFRGVVRKISGAEKRDRDLARAVLAGVVRRAFLKGARGVQACPPLATDPAAPAPSQGR